MFAVIRTGGKQYRVAADDVLKIEKIAASPARSSSSARCWWWGATTVTLGAPTVAGASVAAEVLEQGRGPKVIAFKKRRRKNSRRKRGHRQEFTLLRVTEILTDGRSPQDRGAQAERKAAAEAPPRRAPMPQPAPSGQGRQMPKRQKAKSRKAAVRQEEVMISSQSWHYITDD
jgi:large subunit ribosomal protein L21